MYGSKVLQAVSGQASQQIFSFAELNDLFGASCNMANTVVLVANEDWTANACQVTAFCTDTAWHVGFSKTITNSVRVNYLAIRF